MSEVKLNDELKKRAEGIVESVMKIMRDEFKFTQEESAFRVKLNKEEDYLSLLFNQKVYVLLEKNIPDLPFGCGIRLSDAKKVMHLPVINENTAMWLLYLILHRMIDQLKFKKANVVNNSKQKVLIELLKSSLKAETVGIYYEKGDYHLHIVTKKITINRRAKFREELIEYGRETIALLK